MKSFFKKTYKKILLFGFDLIVYICSFMTSVIFIADLKDPILILPMSAFFSIVVMLFRVIFGIYNQIYKYADTIDYIQLFVADLISLATCLLLWIFVPWLKPAGKTSIVIASLTSLIIITFARFVYRRLVTYRGSIKLKRAKKYVAIFGAGEAGIMLINEMKHNSKSEYVPYCLFDDDAGKQGCHIAGCTVRGTGYNMVDILKKTDIREIIIAVSSISTKRKKEIVESCTAAGFTVKAYEYSFEQIDKNDGNLEQRIKNINIEDLLFRDVITLSSDAGSIIGGKTVLVTGGGGSIGSELCRQISSGKPKKLIILDIYENNAYDIQNELKRKYGKSLDLETVISSVRDRSKIDAIFAKYRPQIVFHAAAHKHVPLMEDSCDEAIKNNVFGTLNVADAAEKYRAEKMILISTDKAVNPTNVMGATKRICEMIIQSRADSKTDYLAVRFGNVLGSNGSVIPLFRRQLESGGPITVTDKRIIRYFMTIPEATSLVLEAAALANKSEVFVLDMGSPVKILDLAENMIKLAGLRPYEDIKIVEIGLRPGEKLYEELLINYDNCRKTDNEKIFVEHMDTITRSEVNEKLRILKAAADSGDNEAVRQAIHETVPTYCVENISAKEAIMCAK